MARRLASGLLAAALMVTFSAAPSQALTKRAKAILYSLAIPGAGHLYMGRTTRAQVFGAAELGVWTGFATFRVQGHTRKEDYIEMAEVFAGVKKAHLITGDATWNWTSEEWQTNYRLRRADSERAYRNAKYALAVGLLNRLVSAVDAARLSVAGDPGSGDAGPAAPEEGMQAPALTFGLTENGAPYAALTAVF
jgi:hypothetical protein